MSRKPKKGYFVRGQFVAEGSELDLQLKAELKGSEISKTDLKRESTELQKLGEDLLTLRTQRLQQLNLPESLATALEAIRRITHFEGRRRQMQYIGKLMRRLDEGTLSAARAALSEQHAGSARDTLALHEAERWRDALIANDDALTDWLSHHPGTDAQQLRALLRQARKEAAPDAQAISKGLAPRRGRAFRELFQLVRDQLQAGANGPDGETAESIGEAAERTGEHAAPAGASRLAKHAEDDA